jgi:hypothetical protein
MRNVLEREVNTEIPAFGFALAKMTGRWYLKERGYFVLGQFGGFGDWVPVVGA